MSSGVVAVFPSVDGDKVAVRFESFEEADRWARAHRVVLLSWFPLGVRADVETEDRDA